MARVWDVPTMARNLRQSAVGCSTTSRHDFRRSFHLHTEQYTVRSQYQVRTSVLEAQCSVQHSALRASQRCAPPGFVGTFCVAVLFVVSSPVSSFPPAVVAAGCSCSGLACGVGGGASPIAWSVDTSTMPRSTGLVSKTLGTSKCNALRKKRQRTRVIG